MITGAIGTDGEGLTAVAPDAAHWICLAAAPTFAIMALLAGIHGDGPQHMLCSPAHDPLRLTGMTWMYMLMSAFHSAPWLRLIASRRGGADRS